MTDSADYPLVYVVILNWDGWHDTIKCIESLKRVIYPNFIPIVVDNASTNDSVERIKKVFPDLELFEMETNTGFSGGNNFGIQYALNNGADYVLLLNNDVIVDPLFLSTMVNEMEKDENTGALNPKIYYLNDSRGNVFWSTGGKTNLWLASSSSRGQGQTDSGQFDEPTEVDFGTGCCLLISREALGKVGLLDDNYFAYYEDADWSYRLRQNGLKVKYTPKAKIWHAVQASSKVTDTGSGTLSPFVHFLAARNHLWFLRSYTSYPQKLTAYPAYFVRRILFFSIGFVVLRRWEKLRELWRGFRAGLKEKPNWVSF